MPGKTADPREDPFIRWAGIVAWALSAAGTLATGTKYECLFVGTLLAPLVYVLFVKRPAEKEF